MSPSAEQALSMLSDGATLFLVASGLAVVFGLMQIINFAHGAFIMVGAYCAVFVAQVGGSAWLALPLSLLVGAAVGLLVERACIRPLSRELWRTMLATIAVGMVLVAVAGAVFGVEAKFVPAPTDVRVDLGFVEYPAYRLVVIGIAALLGTALWLLFNRTMLGLKSRAVIADEPLAGVMRIDTSRIRSGTFMLGAALAAFAGVLIAPTGSVSPTMGEVYLVPAFLAVLVAGPSVGALAITSLVFGGLSSWIAYSTTPLLGNLAIVVLAAVALRIMPAGFGEELRRLLSVNRRRSVSRMGS